MAKIIVQSTQVNDSILTAGDYAYTLIDQHYHQMTQQEQGVLSDNDPEYLHHMRVESRRLSTALCVFRQTVSLPKAAREPRIRALTKALGQLRDLDVQLAAIKTDYCDRLNSSQQKLLNRASTALEKQRCQALIEVKAHLTGSHYQKLKTAYEAWLKKPQYAALANLPLPLLLPELLSPLLSVLLLHPAWLISVDETSAASRRVLHDLRKTCKSVRYQAEFFAHYYSQAFQDWIDQLKELQDNLGKLQDACVLRQLLTKELPEEAGLPGLQQSIQTDLVNVIADWETVRHRYLDPDFRCHLHQMMLTPSISALTT